MLYSNRDYAISIYSGTSVLVDWSHVWLTKNYGFRPEFRCPSLLNTCFYRHRSCTRDILFFCAIFITMSANQKWL